MRDHMNIVRMMKTDAFIDDKIMAMSISGYNVKSFDNVYNKIKMIRKLESSYGLGYLDVAYTKTDDIQMTNSEYNLIKKMFRTTKSKPKNLIEFKTLYISMLKNVMGSDSITGTKSRKKADRDNMIYILNIDMIKTHISLDGYSNKNYKNYDAKAILLFEIVVPEIANNTVHNNQLDAFIDDSDDDSDDDN